MNIYIMRHGTTVWNEKGIIQGRSNNRLSTSGKSFTEQMAKIYSYEKFDVIFSSPLTRTIQTANIMNKYHNVKINKDERLIEINQGIFTKRLKASLTDIEKKQRLKREQSCGMESYESVFNRTKDFLLEIMQNRNYDNVLIVTHAITASLLEKIITKQDIDFTNEKDLRDFKNAEIKVFHCNYLSIN